MNQQEGVVEGFKALLPLSLCFPPALPSSPREAAPTVLVMVDVFHTANLRFDKNLVDENAGESIPLLQGRFQQTPTSSASALMSHADTTPLSALRLRLISSRASQRLYGSVSGIPRCNVTQARPSGSSPNPALYIADEDFPTWYQIKKGQTPTHHPAQKIEDLTQIYLDNMVSGSAPQTKVASLSSTVTKRYLQQRAVIEAGMTPQQLSDDRWVTETTKEVEELDKEARLFFICKERRMIPRLTKAGVNITFV
ncbi:uncharacterized protein PAC_11600 [Phialocephala subalpina]|uniref:Uncharacterized protein n=1 Tax=Phialocephala subalpina TaxID=576137 RepID=A0A1L7X9J8_9HELO|nr:uncharacterized protein PAC_11600 [Phialocephala subalpina]